MTNKELQELSTKIANLQNELIRNPDNEKLQSDILELIFSQDLSLSEINILDELIQEKLI